MVSTKLGVPNHGTGMQAGHEGTDPSYFQASLKVGKENTITTLDNKRMLQKKTNNQLPA